jgi:hypothetical protein
MVGQPIATSGEMSGNVERHEAAAVPAHAACAVGEVLAGKRGVW